MKKILAFITLGLFFNTSLFSQSVLKIWAWEVTSVGGARVNPDVEDKQPQQRNPRIHYLVYAETKPSTTLNNTMVFINGKAYKAQLQCVKTTPIKNERNETLVPSTKNTIYEVLFAEEEQHYTPSYKTMGLVKNNQLVISYMQNKKLYHAALKVMKKKTVELM
jgi:hypothetical protein